MIVLWNLIVGLVVLYLVGTAARPLLDRVKRSYVLPPPADSLKEKWSSLTQGDRAGAALGHLERLTFFVAFWFDAPAVVAAWLAFKVASKWNVWSNVISVPKTIPGIDELDYFIARRKWGSQVLMTFLIGTLFNVLAGFVAARVGLNGYDLLRSICRVVGINAP
jgi:hypothetical protein